MSAADEVVPHQILGFTVSRDLTPGEGAPVAAFRVVCSCGWARNQNGLWSNEIDARLDAAKMHEAHASEVAV